MKEKIPFCLLNYTSCEFMTCEKCGFNQHEHDRRIKRGEIVECEDGLKRLVMKDDDVEKHPGV